MRSFLPTSVIALGGVLLIAVIGGLFFYTLNSAKHAQARDETYQRVIGTSVVLEQRIERALASASLIADAMEARGGVRDGIETTIGRRLQQFPELVNIRLVPQVGKSILYRRRAAPETGAALSDADRPTRIALEFAEQTGSVVLLPHSPQQDGRTIVTGAMPVFSARADRSRRNQLWGYVFADVDLQVLAAGLALQALLGRDARYAIATDDKPARTLVGSAAIENPVSIPISVPGDTWRLLVDPRPGSIALHRQIETWAMLALLAGLCAMLVVITMQRGRMHQLALYDSLTGLPNRRLFFERAEHTLALARRRKESIGVLFVDADRFKAINDSLGHDAGDEVLRHIANQLRGVVRESDIVARFAGDEFVLLLHDAASLAELGVVAEKIAAAMQTPVTVRGRPLPISVSTGASIFPGDGDDIESLLRKADQRMYDAKGAAARS